MWEWLAAPIDPDRVHEVGIQLSWHARLMVFAWGGCVPIGILAARFFKIWPGQSWPKELDNRAWWHTHRVCQYSGGILMLVALGLILTAPPRTLSPQAILPGPHAWFGWIVLSLALLQIASGVLRGSKGGPDEAGSGEILPGDHYDMTRHRLVFEYIHKFAGYVAVLLSVAAILTGLYQSNGPNWMWLSLLLWWSLLLSAFIAFQRRGMAVDTYEAIWGPDEQHPGNRRRPIGVGVRRLGASRGEQL